MKTTTTRLLALTALALFTHAAIAADASSAPTTDRLTPARAQIAAKQWASAVEELRRVNDTGSADWNNLMGYSLRKGKSPDLAGAERHYSDALRIDPKHLGALEYSGELYLMKGELATAEQRLATLGAACQSNCAEYRELKKAIERYKAAGNKYVASW